MNKPQKKDKLIPVREYIYIGKRGKPVSHTYIYWMIQQAKKGIIALPFEYVEQDNYIYIIE